MVTLFQQIIQTGVDYVTATTTTTDGRERFDFYGRKWLREETANGNECARWKGHGFDGLRAGCVQYGNDGNTSLVRISGPDANDKARVLIGWSTNVSRIDFESTVRLNREVPDLASRLERKVKAFKGKHVKAFEVELRRNDIRGETLYLGRRQSERLIRVYNKHAESKHPFYERCWRAEVQFGGKLANLRARYWLDHPADSTLVSDVVFLELRRRGIRWLTFDEQSRHMLKVVPVKMPSGYDRKLEWLRQQIRPTVEDLVVSGRTQAVLDALGLSHYKDEVVQCLRP